MIRRPLYYVAVAFVFEIVLFFYFGKSASFSAILLLMFFCIISTHNIKKESYENDRCESRCNFNKILLVLMSCAVCFCNLCIYENGQSRIDRYVKSVKTSEGIVKHCEEKKLYTGMDFMQYRVRIFRVNGKDTEKYFDLLVKDYNIKTNRKSIIPGDTVTIVGKAEKAPSNTNPNCFDYSKYLMSTGISAVVEAEKPVKSSEEASIKPEGRLYMLKERFKTALRHNINSREVAVISGIMFGDKQNIDEETMENFRKNGTAHILAVSGIHVGIIYGFLSFLWRWKKEKAYFLTVTVFFLCYVVMASFSPSVIRAVFMVEAHMLSNIINRRYDLSSAAFLIAVISMIRNPMQIFHAGFQMSYLAVLTMTLFLPYIKRLYTGVLAASAAVQLGLGPYIMYQFNYLSPVAIFVNVPVVIISGLLVPMGFVSFAIFDLCRPLFFILSKCMSMICTFLLRINELACIDGITVFDVTSPNISAISAYYLILMLFFSENGRILFMKRNKKAIAILMVFVIISSVAFGVSVKTGFEKADITFVDVGQGDCIHIKTEENKNFLIDGGGKPDYSVGKKILKPYLLKNGVGKIDGAFVTHLHTDHYKGIAELCREGMVEKLFLYEGSTIKEKQILKETGLKKEDIIYIHKGVSIKLGKNSKADILGPGRKAAGEYINAHEDDENENCLIISIVQEGKKIIATGDIDSASHDKLFEYYGEKLNADILKVAHHGSKYSYSEDFTDSAKPEYAVIQVGKNNYGHPSGEVIKNYLEEGAKVYRNDTDGAVGFVWKKGGNITVVTVKAEKNGSR